MAHISRGWERGSRLPRLRRVTPAVRQFSIIEIYSGEVHYCGDDMDLQDAHNWLNELLNELSIQFHRLPGSAIFLRYVKSSYQNDPIRSAVELFLFLFAVRYLLAPAYKPQNDNFVKLSDEVSGSVVAMTVS